MTMKKIALPKTKNVVRIEANNKGGVKRQRVVEKKDAHKIKMARDSFTMPKDEYGQLKLLKSRLAELDRPVKKSELLRAGIKQLFMMTDTQLMAAMAAIPIIKTGRPKKQGVG